MRYFLDTEFLEDDKHIELVSLGLVGQDGREFYACNLDADLGRVARDDWMRANVLPELPPWSDPAWMDRVHMRTAIQRFFYPHGTLAHPMPATAPTEFWAYYGASDWVAFYQLMGGKLLGLPKEWPKWFHELKQLCVDKGNPKLPDKPGGHHALRDARWNASVHHFLTAT